MISVYKKTACLLCAGLAVLSLSACSESAEETIPQSTEIITLPTAPVEEETVAATDPKELVEELALVLEAGEVYTLEHYPNLKSVDLTGSTCYDAIANYMEKHPEVSVTYTVDFGGSRVPNTAATAALEPGGFTYDSLMENLRYLPNLTAISLPEVNISTEQINALVTAYPNIALNYTIEILGNSYDSSMTELDLSGMDSSHVEDAAAKLGLMTNLTFVKLSDSLTKADVAKLQDACPNAAFEYHFGLFGQTLSTLDTEVVYKNQNIGNDGEAEIRSALDILDNCSRFVLDNCKIDNEVLAQIREDYRDQTKVVWRVYFGVNGRYNYLTDVETMRTVKNVTNDTCGPLKYCEDVKYFDMGHNDYLTDVSFISYMTKLEVLIASGSAIKSLPDMTNLDNLTWLELANCLKLTDIENIVGCENLKYLNLSYTQITSLMALDGLPLERFVYLRPHVSAAEQNTFKEIHPDCLTVFYGSTQPYGYGWRYDDNGKTMFWYYEEVVREVFNYDQADAILDAQKKAEGN